MNTIAKVLEFHEAFGCAIGEKPPTRHKVPFHRMYEYSAALDHLKNALTTFRALSTLSPQCLRLALITEELTELVEACIQPNQPADALDALVDLRYVLDGTVIAFGFHTDAVNEFVPETSRFDAAFNRVHDANMAKLHAFADGSVGPKHDAAGKVIKPPGWVAPDLSDLVV